MASFISSWPTMAEKGTSLFAFDQRRATTGSRRHNHLLRRPCANLFGHDGAVGAVGGEDLHLARSTGVGCANWVFDAQYVTSE
jgi:hypothetical protein